MSCAENLTSFTGNIMSFFFQQESVLPSALNPTMVDAPTSQTKCPPLHIEYRVDGPAMLSMQSIPSISY